MKVLFVSNFYPPKAIGGYERLCHEVAAAFVEAEHEVAVLTSTPDGVLRGYPGQRIHRTLQLLADPVDIYAPFSATGEERAAIDGANLEWRALEDGIVATFPAELGQGAWFFVEAPEGLTWRH